MKIVLQMLLCWHVSFPERSRKRHKSDDQATLAKRRALPALPSAMTPLSSTSSSSIFRDGLNSDGENCGDSDEEDCRFDLPAFKLPGTPATGTGDDKEGAMSAPDPPKIESVTQRRTKPKRGKNADTLTEVGVTAEQGAKGNGGVTSERRKSGRQIAKDRDGGESGKQQQRSRGESGESEEKTVRLKKGRTKHDSASTESEVVSKNKCELVSAY